MNRPSRMRRVAKLSGVATSLLVLSLWGLSLRHEYGFEISARYEVNFGSGRAMLLYDFPIPTSWITDDIGWSTPVFHFYSIDVCSLDGNDVQRPWILFVPLWVPFLLAAIPTVVLFLRDRRLIPPGHCRMCGYNLTGNTSGVCSECGTRIPSSPGE